MDYYDILDGELSIIDPTKDASCTVAEGEL